MSEQITDIRSFIDDSMRTLGIDRKQLCELMGVDIRTVTRWISNEHHVPKVNVSLIESWIKLKKAGLAWKPGYETVAIPLDKVSYLIKLGVLVDNNE